MWDFHYWILFYLIEIRLCSVYVRTCTSLFWHKLVYTLWLLSNIRSLCHSHLLKMILIGGSKITAILNWRLGHNNLLVHLFIGFKICVKNNVVVILGDISFKIIVFWEETEKFLWRSVIAQPLGPNGFSLEHQLKKYLSYSISLTTLMNIKVENA